MMNEQIRQELEAALENAEKAREKIKNQLDKVQEQDNPEESQVHLLVNYKLELLDLKLRLQDMLKHLHLIKFD